MRFLYVVRFKAYRNGPNSETSTKSFRTVAKDSKAAAQRMRKKGRVISVKKVKKVLP